MSWKRLLGGTTLALITVLSVVASPIRSDAATASACQTRWGSLPERASSMGSAELLNIRPGRHACFDRLVVDLDGDAPGYTVGYTDEVVEQGRGHLVPLRGGAFLEVLVSAPGHDDAGHATYLPKDPSEAVSVRGYRTLRQVSWGNSFEGQSQIGVGVRARLPFRVFTLDGPGDGSRLVIDVAHVWPKDASRSVDVFLSTGGGTDCSEVQGFDRDSTGVVAPIRFSLDQLVAGPTATEAAAGAGSHFSAATADSIRSIKLSKGLLTVDFTDIRGVIPNASTSCGSAGLLATLNSTVFQFSNVERVRYQIDGSCDTFANWLQRSCTEFDRSHLS